LRYQQGCLLPGSDWLNDKYVSRKKSTVFLVRLMTISLLVMCFSLPEAGFAGLRA
jgi:hypothetical protein